MRVRDRELHRRVGRFLFLEPQFEDFEAVRAGRDFDFGHLAHLLAHQALCERAGDVDLAVVVVLFADADDDEKEPDAP